MIRKFALVAICLAFGAPAFAQTAADNPFREMARKFRESHDFWQDEKFQRVYDGYFACYTKQVSDAVRTPASRSSTDAAFHNAYVSCEAQRLEAVKAAEARIADFHPDMPSDQRAERAAIYRRTSAVLVLGDRMKKIGLGDAYGDYFSRTQEF
jgi:hypothetical protein